jgi:uncharacterized protein (TIGR00251 family)
MSIPRIIRVKVTPNASKNEITGWLDKDTLKVKLTATPVEGRANKALIEFLAQHFKVKQNKVKIVRGHKSRLKIMHIG